MVLALIEGVLLSKKCISVYQTSWDDFIAIIPVYINAWLNDFYAWKNEQLNE